MRTRGRGQVHRLAMQHARSLGVLAVSHAIQIER